MFYDAVRKRPRQRDDVLNELTKDVMAFLNSAGGTIIYGVVEKGSCAQELDTNHAFELGEQNGVTPEKVVDWLRNHVQPPPTVDVYRVPETDAAESPYYLVIEIPQGQTAHQAKDRRFYKRIGATVQPMEQFEVIDVMNRTRAAALRLKVEMRHRQTRNEWSGQSLYIAITSANFVASEYGAVKLTLAYPLEFDTRSGLYIRSHYESATGLSLGEKYTPHASSITARWAGAYDGSVVFPGDWFDFYGVPCYIRIPKPTLIPNPVYLLQIELFTINALSHKHLYSIQQEPPDTGFQLCEVGASNRDEMIWKFWATYHSYQKDQR